MYSRYTSKFSGRSNAYTFFMSSTYDWTDEKNYNGNIKRAYNHDIRSSLIIMAELPMISLEGNERILLDVMMACIYPFFCVLSKLFIQIMIELNISQVGHQHTTLHLFIASFTSPPPQIPCSSPLVFSFLSIRLFLCLFIFKVIVVI